MVVAGATFYALGMKRRASKPSEERKPTFFAAGGRPQSDISRIHIGELWLHQETQLCAPLVREHG